MVQKLDIEAVRAGDRSALARTISEVENQTREGRLALSEILPQPIIPILTIPYSTF